MSQGRIEPLFVLLEGVVLAVEEVLAVEFDEGHEYPTKEREYVSHGWTM